jgi:hypothetical protein
MGLRQRQISPKLIKASALQILKMISIANEIDGKLAD